MRNFGTELLDSLNLIKGNGSFVTSHSASFVFPGLEVKGLEEIAYPINSLQAKALIQVAHKAPFGKGSETIIDDTVRSAWEIDAEQLHFNDRNWDVFLQKVLANIKPQLGIEEFEVSAHLYKMLIYEKGDFFLPHRDSEKEKGMFGTLIIGLPSKHSGGELFIRFDGEERSVSFAERASNNKIPFVAFYADCEHEIKPITEGYRVCLVYNLIQKKTDKPIRLESLGKHVTHLANILMAGAGSRPFSPGIVLLGHQYTPENFSREQLKLNDRTRAEALLRAAEHAGYYAKMCLVTSYLTGIPDEDDYGWDNSPDEDAEMGEVHDSWVSIEHWLDDGLPPLRNLDINEDELLATFKLNDGDPIVRENTGYMGNYGPDLMHWYHYGAVVFWSKEDHGEKLLMQDIPNQLEWIGYYNTKRKQLSEKETATCEIILNAILNFEGRAPIGDFNVIGEWLNGYADENSFVKWGYPLLQKFFQQIQPHFWSRLVESYPAKHFQKIFASISQQGDSTDLHHLLAILRTLADTPSGRNLAVSQMSVLPKYFMTVASIQQHKQLANALSLKNLLELENIFPQQMEWVEGLAALLKENKHRAYINEVLVPVILNLEIKTNLSASLRSFALENLQDRVDNMPQPPGNWSRELPKVTKNIRMWRLLEAFLESPVDQVFDFRRNEEGRKEMESTIQSCEIDLRFETIKKGSPYTLRIFKTQAAYEKQMKEWREDVALLERIKNNLT